MGTHPIFTLHIQIQDLKPEVWRRMTVDGSDSLGRLHHFIQVAMGWSDSHMHEFNLGDMRYGDLKLDKDGGVGYLDERKIILKRHLMEGSEFTYVYDYGDHWRHRIVVEKVEQSDEPLGVAQVIAGERACPPDDIGGTGEYERFLECLSEEPEGDETLQFLEWTGKDFDPNRFDRHAANAGLLRLAWNRWGGK